MKLLPYKLAVIAKEKGFDEPCLAYWLLNELKYPQEIANITSQKKCAYVTGGILAPLYQQIIDWLQFEKGIHFKFSTLGVLIKSANPDVAIQERNVTKEEYYSILNKSIKEAFKLITT